MLLMASDDTNIMVRHLLCFHSRVDVEAHGPLSTLSTLSLGTFNTKATLRVGKSIVWSTCHSLSQVLSKFIKYLIHSSIDRVYRVYTLAISRRFM